MAWTEQKTVTTASNAGGVDLSPGNTYLAAGAGGGQVDVWDFETETNVFSQGGYTTCNSVRFGPGTNLLSYSENTTNHQIHHVDVDTWTELSNATFPTHNVYSGFDYSTDGQYFCHNYNGSVEIRSVGGDEAWPVFDTFTTNTNQKRSMAWNSANGYILSGDRVGNYWVIDTSAWTLTDSGTITNTPDFYQIESHPSEPWFIMADANGNWNVTVVAIDPTAGTLTELQQFSGGDGTAGASSACITDGYLYHTTQTFGDDIVRLADNDTWAQETTIPLQTAVWRSRFSHDGQWLAIADRDNDTVRVYDTPVSAPIAGTVTFNGSPQQGATVYVVESPTDSVVAELTTDTNGEFSYTPTGDGPFHVATQYDDGTTQYNAESYPQIQ